MFKNPKNDYEKEMTKMVEGFKKENINIPIGIMSLYNIYIAYDLSNIKNHNDCSEYFYITLKNL